MANCGAIVRLQVWSIIIITFYILASLILQHL